MIHLSIPVWAILCFLVGMAVGFTWHFFRTRAEMNRLIELVSELTHQLSQYVDPSQQSPLAKAITGFNNSVQNVFHTIPPTCIHLQHPDDCPVCRH